MPSPVSIGDAYLMGKLALKLGKAFTKGRKSAPAEFREVENQLYSLSAAISALDNARSVDGSTLAIDLARLPALSEQQQADGEDVVKSMLRSCEETLKHLEKIVEKYNSIGKQKDPEAPLLKRWSKELKDNWKKVAWTTEGGDLATLRSQLTVHTNSLNLVLGVINM
jgi:MinD-like ATPase involved in chromosome partitioning or flagellar assembly